MYKVMIVDDDPNIRSGLRYIVDWEKYNFTVCSLARNGKDAITQMQSTYPDLIVTDIRMPGLDGLGLIKYIRQKLHDKNMSFIVLSGYDEFKYAKEAIKYNVLSYLLKPVDQEELSNLLGMLDKELSQENVFEYFYNKRVDSFSEKYTEIEEFDNLIDAIQHNDQKDIRKTVSKIFVDFQKIKLYPRLIKLHLDNFLVKISTAINGLGGSSDRINNNSRLFEMDIPNVNIIQLEYSLLDFSLQCGKYIEELKETSGVINKVKYYVNENYHENIKLKDIASMFYINSAYLGQLFKKETGMNFTQYLNKIRIEKARKLLERTDLHVYEIAEKVGYHNSDYFTIKFKESENCTPIEYKNDNKHL